MMRYFPRFGPIQEGRRKAGPKFRGRAALLSILPAASLQAGRNRAGAAGRIAPAAAATVARSVIALEGLAGEPMDVLINGCLIAQGDVVVVNDKLGIRLTAIATPSQRIRSLKK